MFNLTEKSKDFYLTLVLFTNDNNSDTDIGLKSYCKDEYGDEWYYAYNI